ncbi:MAG: recombination protein RecR [Lentisphaeria bacterium]|nr:recombination protein RecR [Lentisphaeria bacterium]
MASGYPEAVESLIGELKQLPGVGRRGAERMALALLARSAPELEALGKLIGALPRTVGRCPKCGGLAEAGSECGICGDPRRDDGVLCVVENMPQLFAVESSGHFHGRYLVLGGKISPLDSENGEGLNLRGLCDLVETGNVREVILALSSDVEGRATAVFLAELLEKYRVKVSRPALGLPAGANLSFADAATIGAALRGRVDVQE